MEFVNQHVCENIKALAELKYKNYPKAKRFKGVIVFACS